MVKTGIAATKLTKREIDIQARQILLKEAINNALSTIGIAYESFSLPTKQAETTPAPAPQPQGDNEQPQKHTNGKFTKEQIERVNKLKSKLEIKSDEEFNKYLQRWNSDIISKRQLTPDNIDDFLNFMQVD
jgi:transketolase